MPGQFYEAINRTFDEYELMRCKAEAFDQVVHLVTRPEPSSLRDLMSIIDNFVSPDTLKK